MNNDKQQTALLRIYADMLIANKKKLIKTQILAIILGIALATTFLFVTPVIALNVDLEQASISMPTEAVDYDRTCANQTQNTQHSRYKDLRRSLEPGKNISG